MKYYNIDENIACTVHGMVHMSDEDKTMENMTTKATMEYVKTLHRRYGWPLKIHARGYDAYLVGAQPLLEGGPTPIYRFPGGNSLVDECEMLPASAENAARRILGCEGEGGCNA